MKHENLKNHPPVEELVAPAGRLSRRTTSAPPPASPP